MGVSRTIVVGSVSLRRRLERHVSTKTANWISGDALVPRRVVFAHVSRHEATRLRKDPTLRGLGHYRVSSEVDGIDLEHRGLPAGRLESIAERKGPGHATETELAPAPNRIAVKIPKRIQLETSVADAVFIPHHGLAACLETIERKQIDWSTLGAHSCASGIVLEIEPHSLRLSVGCVPVRRSEFADGARLWIEATLGTPPGITDVNSPQSALLVFVRDGIVHIEELSDSFTLDRLLRIETISDLRTPRADSDSRKKQESIVETAEIDHWMRGEDKIDNGLASVLVEAFVEITPGSVEPAPSESEVPERRREGWLRHFIRDKLPAGVKRRLEAWGRFKQSTPEGIAEIEERRGRAVKSLVTALSGANWRDAIAAAFPLRRPESGETESPWFHWAPHPIATSADFSLDQEASKGSFGRAPVSRDDYRRLESMYSQIAERFVEQGELRRAAHVFSYLLGDHRRAAACLENAGCHQEAATLYLHLGHAPDRAARALGQAGLHDESARLWMDLGEWERAALDWRKAGDDAQEMAAWRVVVGRHRENRRFLEAADVLERHVGDHAAAIELLEACATSDHPTALEAFRRAFRYHVESGDRLHSDRLIERVADRILRDLRDSPRRASFLACFRWIEAATIGDRLERLSSQAILRTWLDTMSSWAESRGRVHSSQRTEIDHQCSTTAARLSRALGDPWLELDVERQLEDRELAPIALTSTRIPYREIHVGAARCFAVSENRLLVGTDEGTIRAFDDHGDELASWDTRSTRPISHLSPLGTELFAASATEVYHFSLSALERSPRYGAMGTPLQVERQIGDVVIGLAALHGGSAVLRASVRRVHALSPAHLRSMGILQEPEEASVAGVSSHRGFAAVLLQHGRPEARSKAHAEILVYRRRVGAGPGDLQFLESVPLEHLEPRRIRFFRRHRDDLIVIGRETITFLPSKRSEVRVFEREITRSSFDLPPPDAAGLPARGAMLVLYGDGTLEEIQIAKRERRFLLDPPPGKVDPVVGFHVVEKPFCAWIAHQSGLIRHVNDLPRTWA